MLFIISLFIALFTAFCLDKPLKKHPAVFYIAAAVLTTASIVITQSDISVSSRFVRDYVIGIFSRGAIGAAFWAVVMFAGALPNGSAPIKKLMPIRGELSITAAVLTLAHIVTFGMQYIKNLINGRTGSGEAYREFVITFMLSIAMTLIMLPLTVMSFKTVRKKMNAKTWKNIQRLAYLFYAMIYIHIMVLFVPKAQKGREGYFLNVIIYSAVFIGYAVMRVRKYYIANKKPEKKLGSNIVCACSFVLPVILAGVVSHGTDMKSAKPLAAAEDKAVSFTFATETTAAEADVTTISGDKNASATTAIKGTDSKTTTTETVTTNEKGEKSTSEEEETHNNEQEHNDEPEQEQNNEEAPASEPQPSYKYRNGEYQGDAEGYAGKVHVKITIENDVITNISAWSDDDDPDYFGDALNKVIPQIHEKVSADGIDACSGATYSSEGIIEAARKALEQAMN